MLVFIHNEVDSDFDEIYKLKLREIIEDMEDLLEKNKIEEYQQKLQDWLFNFKFNLVIQYQTSNPFTNNFAKT